MRLLFLSKREPQRRDLIERPYGRFHYLPVALAALGHTVRVQLCSHRGQGGVEFRQSGVTWASHDIRTLGAKNFWRSLSTEVEIFRPDWIIGCSDAWFGWLAHLLAKRTNSSLAIDAYDNYEAYMPWNLPLHFAWRRAVYAADVVTAAGPQLAALLDTHRPGKLQAAVVPMAADPMFVPHNRATSRTTLGLPADAPLIGYSGGWARNRGTDVLLGAFQRVREQHADARLVLTGRPPAHALAMPGVHHLGYVDDAQLPLILSALDVACVITADSSFGRYSYPAKLCEAMACNVPVVATATEPVRWMLHNDAHCLAPIGDAQKIAGQVLAQLSAEHSAYPALPTWADSARSLEAVLESASRSDSV